MEQWYSYVYWWIGMKNSFFGGPKRILEKWLSQKKASWHHFCLVCMLRMCRLKWIYMWSSFAANQHLQFSMSLSSFSLGLSQKIPLLFFQPLNMGEVCLITFRCLNFNFVILGNYSLPLRVTYLKVGMSELYHSKIKKFCC